MEFVRCTPTVGELLPSREIYCTYPDCSASFTNIGNLNMHIKRHHDSQPMQRYDSLGRELVFHCPQRQCTYHEMHAEKKHFSTLKYLRQHYQKMHLSKANVCDRCGKGFISYDKLMMHMEKMCGVKYACKVCGWDYDTMEALLTHGKRKGHIVRDVASGETKKSIQIKKVIDKDEKSNNRETQTEEISPVKCTTKISVLVETTTNEQQPCNQETQTDNILSSTQCLTKNIAMHASTNTHPPLELLEPPRHIETQTDDQMLNLLSSTTTFNASPSMHTSLQTAQLLPPSIHTYTQTYDDLLTDSLLGFTDIQTQTNWSSFSDAAVATAEDASTHQYNPSSSATTCTRCSYDELLVSTETQTSFTQCLLESRTTNADTDDVTFSNLYQTQHTQTCDMLLGALFGSQESDLIGGYQSTHTQT